MSRAVSAFALPPPLCLTNSRGPAARGNAVLNLPCADIIESADRKLMESQAVFNHAPESARDTLRRAVFGRRSVFLWIVGYLAAGIALFFCYLHISYTQNVSSDGASNALQAWDMLHGNLLLSGWTLSDVSFY